MTHKHLVFLPVGIIASLLALSAPAAGRDSGDEPELLAALPAGLQAFPFPARAPAASSSPSKSRKPKPDQSENKKKRRTLGGWVMRRAFAVAQLINRTGGYRYDGFNDCYGFVRRTWDPILEFLGKRPVPVDDYPSRTWHPITSLDALLPGDVLGTVQGHAWGDTVHYGLYAGKKHGTPYQLDNTRSATTDGAHFKPFTGRMRYYYGPTHELLEKSRRHAAR